VGAEVRALLFGVLLALATMGSTVLHVGEPLPPIDSTTVLYGHSDTQYGDATYGQQDSSQYLFYNHMTGYPDAQQPTHLLLLGDLTHDLTAGSTPTAATGFSFIRSTYVTPGDYEVWMLPGNHDNLAGFDGIVADSIEAFMGVSDYTAEIVTKDLGGILWILAGEYADSILCQVIADTLDGRPQDYPVVYMQHIGWETVGLASYAALGVTMLDELETALSGHNIVVMIAGHSHGNKAPYLWRGYICVETRSSPDCALAADNKNYLRLEVRHRTPSEYTTLNIESKRIAFTASGCDLAGTNSYGLNGSTWSIDIPVDASDPFEHWGFLTNGMVDYENP
jgi:hypothetical protein